MVRLCHMCPLKLPQDQSHNDFVLREIPEIRLKKISLVKSFPFGA